MAKTARICGTWCRSPLVRAVSFWFTFISTCALTNWLADGDRLHPMQQAFMENHALQCGFCTPGFLMLAVGVLEREPDISDQELLDVLSSNLCRCTGYVNIVKAVRSVAAEMRSRR